MSEFFFGFEIEKEWDYENGFYITSHVSRTAKIIAHYELYKSITNLPGQIVECGVFKGVSLIRFANFREILENTFSRKIIGFDAFGEFPKESSKKDRHFPEHHDNVAGLGIDIDELYRIFNHKNYKNIELIKGDITKTVPEYVEKNKELKISLLHIDTDVFEPTDIILKNLYSRVVPGGLIVFDDYALIHGETEAIDNFFENKKVIFEKYPFLEKPTYVRKH